MTACVGPRFPRHGGRSHALVGIRPPRQHKLFVDEPQGQASKAISHTTTHIPDPPSTGEVGDLATSANFYLCS